MYRQNLETAKQLLLSENHTCVLCCGTTVHTSQYRGVKPLVQFIEIVLKKMIPSLHKSLGVYLPLITTNCAVLGVTINNITDGYNFVESIVSALGCGLGFLLAMVLFSGVRSRIEESEIPESFRGLPVTLIAASFLSLAFFGFAGIVDNLFA